MAIGPASQGGFERLARRVGIVCAAIALSLACSTLVGWSLGTDFLLRLVPQSAPMQPLTAVSLSLLATAMLLRNREGTLVRVVSRLSAVAVMVAVLAIGSRYVLGTETFVERALLPPVRTGAFYAQISPLTAVALLLLAFEILVGEQRRLERLASLASLGALIIAVIALVGHLYGTRYVYELRQPVIAMALETSIALVSLSSSQLLRRPERGLVRVLCSPTLGGFAARRLVVVAIATPFLVAIAIRLARRIGVTDVPLTLAFLAVSMLVLQVVLVMKHAASLDALEALRKTAEQSLTLAREAERNAREQIESVLDQLPDAVFLTDENGTVTFLNRTARGFVRDRRETRFEARSPHGAAIPWVELPLARAAARREVTTNHELAVRRVDGEYVPMLASATPIWDGAGRFLGAVAVLHDVARLKQLERMREQWTSIIAHDLRHPVAVISMSAELLAESEGLRVADRTKVQRILDDCRKLGRMINDLLDVSRLEAQQLSVAPTPVDFPAVVREIVDHAAAALGAPRVRLHLEQEIPRVSVDPGRLEQILFNLLSNAVRYGTPGAEIVVTVEADDGVVEVAVENQGRGIAADDLPRLFSRFERTRAARSSRGSIGLGLYITKGLVEAHGGHIWVESTPGETTTFHFSLPALHDEPAKATDELGAHVVH